MDAKQAKAVYLELRNISEDILTGCGMMTEPHKPVTRTRPFKHVMPDHLKEPLFEWKNIPLGMLYHYTNGFSGIKSMRWCNDPRWGNTCNSWHVTIFDRILSNIVGELWDKLASDYIRKLFPVPTIIMADWRWGTWHGNFSNDVLLGVENRNTGYSGWCRLGKDGIEQLGKEPYKAGGRKWEPYTREQMISNISIGRVARHMFGMSADYFLPHSAVWATKGDTGLAYELDLVRSEVFTDSDLTQVKWLGNYEMAPDVSEKDDFWWEPLSEFRDDLKYVKWVEPEAGIEEHDLVDVAAKLYAMGYHTGPEYPGDAKVRKFVRWFQRSTQAYIYHEKFPDEWALVCDGVAGSKTDKALDRRLKQLKLV